MSKNTCWVERNNNYMSNSYNRNNNDVALYSDFSYGYCCPSNNVWK